MEQEKRTASENEYVCCGGPAPKESDGCCRADADAKAAGQIGCGCSTEPAKPARSTVCC